MSLSVVFRPAASSDIADACAWYEERRSSLSVEFIAEVERSLSLVRANPEKYPLVLPGVHRIVIKRFPYKIYFTVESDRVVVLAVLHARRAPKRWADLA